MDQSLMEHIAIIQATRFGRSKEVIIDADMLEKASKYSWNINNRGYVASCAGLLHRYLFGTDVKEYDHLNRNKLDNRRANVRAVSRSTNMFNTGDFVTNTSGRKGVVFERGRWKAQIKYQQRQITLGRFSSFTDAIMCREKAEQEIASGTFR